MLSIFLWLTTHKLRSPGKKTTKGKRKISQENALNFTCYSAFLSSLSKRKRPLLHSSHFRGHENSLMCLSCTLLQSYMHWVGESIATCRCTPGKDSSNPEKGGDHWRLQVNKQKHFFSPVAYSCRKSFIWRTVRRHM